MNRDLPPFVEAERDALLAEIEEAFDGVDRMCGMSWSQSAVVDQYGSSADLENALRKDRDTRWQDLLAPGVWEPMTGLGGFNFLDPAGFRYYLPAALTLSVRAGYDADILFRLVLTEGEAAARRREQWSELDDRQRRCVRRYLDYMLVLDGILEHGYRRHEYLAALEEYWRAAAEGEVAEVEVVRRPKRKRGGGHRG